MTGWRLFMTGYFCLSAVNLSWAKNMNRQSAILSRLWQLLEPSLFYSAKLDILHIICLDI